MIGREVRFEVLNLEGIFKWVESDGRALEGDLGRERGYTQSLFGSSLDRRWVKMEVVGWLCRLIYR